MKPSPSDAGQDGKLAPKTKIAWGMGSHLDVLMANVLGYLALPIYNVALGVDPKLLGWAMGLPRAIDAMLDPVIGNISDNARTRWGRRRPFMVCGALLCGLMFFLIWCPPVSLGKEAIGIYFLIASTLFYIAYGIYSIPWGAMGMELTSDYNERTSVMAYRTFIQAIGGLFLGGLWWLALRLGRTEVEGVRWVGLIFGVYIAITGLLPCWFCRERIALTVRHSLRLMPALKATLSNGVFLRLGAIMFLLLLALFLCNPLSLYINIYHVFGGNKDGVSSLNLVTNTVFQLTGLALTPLAVYLGRKLGKKRALLIGIGAVIVSYLSSWICYTPRAPYLQVISLALAAPGLSCIWVLTASMLADVCDVDELSTGLRREGMYGAVFAWLCKCGIAGTMVLSGYILDGVGYRAELGMQSADTILMMRLLYMIVPVAFLSLAFGLAWFYPLDEEQMTQIHEQLRARRDAEPEVVSTTTD